MANKVGNNLVKIWIAVVKRPVVHALREFIRATLKDEDYFAEDVRLVPHKLVVKGAGKKIPGVTPEAAPESMATPPAASSTSPSIPSPSSRSPNPSPRHSHPTVCTPLSTCIRLCPSVFVCVCVCVCVFARLSQKGA